MSLYYGVFTTDGEYERGNFPGIDRDVPELVKKLADSDVALHLKITETQVILGSAINLRVTGGRKDSRVFIIRYSDGDNLRSLDLPDILKRFFPSAIEYLEGANYHILDVWGEEQLSGKIGNLGDNPLPPVGDISRLVAGKLLTGVPVQVEGRDLFRALCLISEVATMVKPLDYLEYTFVVSRLSFVDADLLVGPNKPLNTEFDLNLDTGKILALAGLEQKYRQIEENARKEPFARKVRNREFRTKQELAAALTQESWKGLPGMEKREGEKTASPQGLPASLSAKETVDATLKTGNDLYWGRYTSGPRFNLQEFRGVMLNEPWDNFERFVRIIRPSLQAERDPLRSSIYDVLMEKVNQLHARADQTTDLLSGMKPGVRPAPAWGKESPEEEELFTTRGPRRLHIAVGILVLIIAAAIIGISLLPKGETPVVFPPERVVSDEQGVPLAILNMTKGKDSVTGFSRLNTSELPGNMPVDYAYDNRTYHLNASKILNIEPAKAQIEGTLKIYTPELTTGTGLAGHYNASSGGWEEIIPIINQPDFTIPVTSGGIYGVFS